MILSNKRITKALIRLRGWAGWSAPVLFANPPKTDFLATTLIYKKLEYVAEQTDCVLSQKTHFHLTWHYFSEPLCYLINILYEYTINTMINILYEYTINTMIFNH